MIRILALLCQLSHPDNCNWTTITTSEQLQMSDCYNQAKLAQWMRSHPAERVARVRCEFGNRQKGKDV